jgi:hypothetical protein
LRRLALAIRSVPVLSVPVRATAALVAVSALLWAGVAAIPRRRDVIRPGDP